MIESRFQEISQELNGNYQHETKKYNGGMGARLPVTLHRLDIDYNGSSIDVKYEFGNLNLGKFLCTIKSGKRIPDFKIETRSNLGRLFTKGRSPWKIKCSDGLLAEKIKLFLKETDLEKIVQETSFEPSIIGETDQTGFNVKMQFYLGFENKEESILPIINFYKKMIDHLN